jgi:hypothetical protein
MNNKRLIEDDHSKFDKTIRSESFFSTFSEISECGHVCAVIYIKPGSMTTKLLSLLETTYGYVLKAPKKIEHSILLPIYKSINHSELAKTVNTLKITVNEFSCDLIHWSVTVN